MTVVRGPLNERRGDTELGESETRSEVWRSHPRRFRFVGTFL